MEDISNFIFMATERISISFISKENDSVPMYNRKENRICSDTVRLLMLAAVLFAALAVAYVSLGSDDSSAETMDGTTYFYDQLTPTEKQIVDKIDELDFTVTNEGGIYYATFVIDFGETYKGRTVSEVSALFANVPDKVLPTMLWERPTYYWITNDGMHGNLSYSYLGDIVQSCTYTVRFNNILTDYGNTKEQIIASMNTLNTTINGVPGIDTTTRLSTITGIHNNVCGLLTYYPSKPIPGTMDIRNTYTALVDDHIVVCEGYSRAFKALCDRFDVPCLIIVGSGVGSTGTEGHMWNQVQMDNDRWYLVDCTWDDQDPTVSTYLLAGTTTMGFNSHTIAEDHIVSETEYEFLSVPSISTKSYANDVYTLTFLNYDGSTIEVQPNKAYDDPIVAPTATYTDALIGTFTFDHWDPTVPDTVTKDMTFTAVYDIAYVDYTFTYHPANGESDIVQIYHYNDTVTLPAEPEKAADATFTYKFSSWSPAVPETVTGNGEFTAQYEYLGATVKGSDGFEFTAALKTALADADKFTVTMNTDDGKPLAKITFNKAAIDGFTAGETLTVTEIDPSTLNDAVKQTLEKSKIYHIDFGTNNGDFAIGGKATVALYYEKSAIDKIAGITLYYVNGDTLEQLGYNYEDNYVVFETTHFSDYAIKSVLRLSGIYWYIPIIAILIFAIIGFALAYRYG